MKVPRWRENRVAAAVPAVAGIGLGEVARDQGLVEGG
jgi:hypothetical protein